MSGMYEDDVFSVQEVEVCSGKVWKVVREADCIRIYDDTGQQVHRAANWEMTAVHLAMALAREYELRPLE